MDRTSEEKREGLRERVHTMLSAMTLDEISYILGRYCGRSNTILSQKKFGFIMPTDLVEEALSRKAIETILLGDN